jgi:hypothetical protein
MYWAVMCAARAERRNTTIAAIASGAVFLFSRGILAAMDLSFGLGKAVEPLAVEWRHVVSMAKQQSFGRAIALKFAGNGAAVRILDLNPNDAD